MLRTSCSATYTAQGHGDPLPRKWSRGAIQYLILGFRSSGCSFHLAVAYSRHISSTMGFASKLAKRLEVKHEIDQYAEQGTTKWGNKDIYPIIPERRTFNGWAYFTYWATAGICISSYTLGSSMIGIGLTAGQAMGAVVIATVCSSLLSFFTGQMGRIHHVGFFMNLRSTFGLWGANFMICLNVFGSIIYFGVQAMYGAQAIVVILNAIFPSYLRMKNTIPAR